MRGTYLGKLLDSVLEGSESAYKQFLHDRLKPPQQCDLMGMLSYLLKQSKLNENGLSRCYPEALVELGYFIHQIFNVDDIHIRVQIKEFILSLFQASFAGNVGAQTALVLTIDSINDPAFANGLNKLIPPQNLDEFDQHQLVLCGTVAFLQASKSREQNARTDIERSGSKYPKAALAQDYSVAINSSDAQSVMSKADKEFVSSEECDLKAIDCFERAAAQGNAVALVNLGSMYRHGRTGKASASQEECDLKAAEYYEKASMLGNALALANLGYMYFDGKAGKALASQEERDLKAVEYFEMASMLGNTVALINLSKMYAFGKAGKALASQKERDLKAVECLEKASVLGSADADYVLGFIYLYNKIDSELPIKERLEKAKDHFLMCLYQGGANVKFGASALKHIIEINEKLMQLPHSLVPAILSPSSVEAVQNAPAISLRETYESQQISTADLRSQIVQLNSVLNEKNQLIQRQVEIIINLNKQLADAIQLQVLMQQFLAASSQVQQKQSFSSAGRSTFFSFTAMDAAAVATDTMETESLDAAQSASSSADYSNSDTGKRGYNGVPNDPKRTKNNHLAR